MMEDHASDNIILFDKGGRILQILKAFHSWTVDSELRKREIDYVGWASLKQVSP